MIWPNHSTCIFQLYLRYVNSNILSYREIIKEYSNAIRKVATELFQSFSLIMEMDKEALLGLHKQLVQAYRVNYYPPCSKPDQVLGVSPHSDTSTITILMQEDDVCGLQIKNNNEWVPVNPIPDALVVNVGDVFEVNKTCFHWCWCKQRQNLS